MMTWYTPFLNILSWVYDVLGRILPKKEKGSLIPFNLGTIVSPRMKWALTQWSLSYIGLEPWLFKDDGITPNGDQSLHIPAIISAKLANAVTIEMDVKITGSERADFLNDYMQRVLYDIRRYVEYGCAKGGLLIKPFVTEDYQLANDYSQADLFFPVAFDSNSKLTAVCPVDMKLIDGKFYKRFEYQTVEKEGVHIYNRAYKSDARDAIGDECSLAEVPEWAELDPEAMMEGARQLLCGYFKMPFANNVDPLSPLGVSCFARAMETIKETDQLWTAFCWEVESGKRRLYVDQLAFTQDKNGKPILPKDPIYRTLNLGTALDDEGFFKEWSPTLREMSYINALELHFRMIETQCGFSEGFLPRPAPLQMATATEVKMSKQDSFLTISDTQKALKTALEDALYAADYLATVYDLAPAGLYNVEFSFDDSIVHDKDSEFTQDSQSVGQRTMSRLEFRMRNYDETEDMAKKQLAIIDADAANQSTFFPQEEPVNPIGA